jgi:hypothetical protein
MWPSWCAPQHLNNSSSRNSHSNRLRCRSRLRSNSSTHTSSRRLPQAHRQPAHLAAESSALTCPLYCCTMSKQWVTQRRRSAPGTGLCCSTQAGRCCCTLTLTADGTLAAAARVWGPSALQSFQVGQRDCTMPTPLNRKLSCCSVVLLQHCFLLPLHKALPSTCRVCQCRHAGCVGAHRVCCSFALQVLTVRWCWHQSWPTFNAAPPRPCRLMVMAAYPYTQPGMLYIQHCTIDHDRYVTCACVRGGTAVLPWKHGAATVVCLAK